MYIGQQQMYLHYMIIINSHFIFILLHLSQYSAIEFCSVSFLGPSAT